VPFEVEWQKNPYNWQQITEWHDKGNNYGVLGGYGNLIVVDADEPEVVELMEQAPETFTIKTGGLGNKFHYYYFCPDITNKIVLYNVDGRHMGEIISTGTQVVGAGSTHASGNQYTIAKNYTISTISKDLLLGILKPVLNRSSAPASTTASTQNSGTGRNVYLTQRAGSLYNTSMTASEFSAALHAINLASCSPPLETKEVDNIVKSALKSFDKKEAGTGGSALQIASTATLTNALLIAAQSSTHSTGLEMVDSYLDGGFRETKTYLLAGRTGSGKTRISVGLLQHMDPATPILYVSSEMDQEEIMALLVAHKVNYSCNDIARGEDTPGSVDAYNKYYPNFLITTKEKINGQKHASITVEDVQATLTSVIASGIHPKIVVVDYITHLDDPSFKDLKNARTMYGNMASALNDIAEEFGVAMLILAQTNRSQIKGTEYEDTMVSESDKITHVVDATIGITKNTEIASQIKLTVSKNRVGASGTINLCMDWQKNELYEAAKHHTSTTQAAFVQGGVGNV
jgi:KaiC/GvpD/RAD55 family RecA-like ATPase